YLRDAHHIFAPAGTSDIQLLRLGEVALGQDKGSWSERLSDLVRTPELEPSPA
ncbi:acyl-CoA dehydrogenase, partial [Streptomyces hydrogenans]